VGHASRQEEDTAHRQDQSQRVELAAELPEVSECHRITGEDCFLIKVHAAAIEELEATLDRFLLYGQTVTSIVVSSPVPPRPLPVT
jgi:Lrp/AsnC family transcriptional regulator, leucine-responsive regulatory protein